LIPPMAAAWLSPISLGFGYWVPESYLARDELGPEIKCFRRFLLLAAYCSLF
jgi:hypothetical protein